MRKRAEALFAWLFAKVVIAPGDSDEIKTKIEAELNAAVDEYRSKVPPPDEIHRDGAMEERERCRPEIVKTVASLAVLAVKVSSNEVHEELLRRRDALAALLTEE